jgi:hypothetical protein
MATPRKPRTQKSVNTMHIDLIPVAPTRRRQPRQPPTSVMERCQPIQNTLSDADRVRARIVDATVAELSKVSLGDAAMLVRAAVKGQPINATPVARLVVLGVLNLGLVVYDYLAPAADAPPPGTR